jgi:hypothetical protein
MKRKHAIKKKTLSADGRIGSRDKSVITADAFATLPQEKHFEKWWT